MGTSYPKRGCLPKWSGPDRIVNLNNVNFTLWLPICEHTDVIEWTRLRSNGANYTQQQRLQKAILN